MSGRKIFTVSRVIRLSLLLLSATAITSCGEYVDPYVGMTGKKQSYSVPVEVLVYTDENISGGSVISGGSTSNFFSNSTNDGCIPNTNGVNDDEVGKKRHGGGSCGAAYLPMKWKPGMMVRINWRVSPYPEWHARGLNVTGIDRDPIEAAILDQYDENYSEVIPLPPPSAFAGNHSGKAKNITIHFLACNQILIDYGTRKERAPEVVKKQFELFAKSQKLCTPRPSIKSMADYRRNKAGMDAIKQERANIKQVILPEYIKELKQQGKQPVTGK